jgi:hypothetical protein
MNKENVLKWSRLFNEGRSSEHNKEHSGCPSVITESLKDRIDAHLRENRRFAFDDLHEEFPLCFTIFPLSQFKFNTEKFVPDWFQKCSQMNTSRRIKLNSYGLVKSTGGRLL